LNANANNAAMAAPNNSYGAYNSATNPPPLGFDTATSVFNGSTSQEVLLESTNVYYAADAGASAILFCNGWTDNL
ncbi:hypothetical protein, partial [Streptococcus pneumoniae]|uniref:hypothetical protein n=1 Tax=Streptococcus pneumoniae TaxID=1313 RepID=UPI001E359C66